MFCGTFFMNSLAGITMQALLCHFVKPVTQLFKLHKLLYVFHTHGVSLPYPQATMFVCITLSDLYRGAPPPRPISGVTSLLICLLNMSETVSRFLLT